MIVVEVMEVVVVLVVVVMVVVVVVVGHGACLVGLAKVLFYLYYNIIL